MRKAAIGVFLALFLLQPEVTSRSLQAAGTETAAPASSPVQSEGMTAQADGGPRQWGEEELLLRLLLGIVYPFSLLVVFRLVRTGILRWERDWRGPAARWIESIGNRRGYPAAEGQAHRLVRMIVGVERLTTYSTVVVLYSFVWFALFPQTRALAGGLLDRIIGPALEFIGFTARSVLLLTYTAVVAVAAVLINRYLSEKHRRVARSGPLADPVIYFPLRGSIWLVAVFLTLFPYPGVPRIAAVGILLLALLACVLAIRPLAEEVAAGIYLSTASGLKKGDRLTIDGDACVVRERGLVHVQLEQGERKHWLPYSRLLKAALTVGSGGEQ